MRCIARFCKNLLPSQVQTLSQRLQEISSPDFSIVILIDDWEPVVRLRSKHITSSRTLIGASCFNASMSLVSDRTWYVAYSTPFHNNSEQFTDFKQVDARDTANFDIEFTSEAPTDSYVDDAVLSQTMQKQFEGWSYNRPVAGLGDGGGSVRDPAFGSITE